LQKKAILALEKQNYDQAEEHMKKILTNNPLSRKDIIIASAANPLLGLTLVQGGTFLMGTEGGGDSDEALHEVTLSSFEMSRYEVTNLQYAAFLNRYGSDTVKTGEFKGLKLIYEHSWGVKKNENGLWQAQADYEYHPVVYVTWYGANEYCNYYGVQLPTEAQWEYAAGGGKDTKYVETRRGASLRTGYAGTDSTSLLGEYAWYSETSKGKGTFPVGTKKPNPLGIYDLSGNVWEWCEDWYDENFYKNNPKKDPVNISKTSYKSLRGGSWGVSLNDCRVAYRGGLYPNSRDYYSGFRFVGVGVSFPAH